MMIELIINPVAGNGRAKQIGEEAAARLKERKVDFVMNFTEYPGHATELARQAAERGINTAVAIGGDGTVSEVARGLCGTQTALGIIPAGTGNDFIKTVAIPKNWQEALDFMIDHPARLVNTGVMNDRFFLNVCGAGFDVMVLDYALEAKKYARGIWPYLYGVIRAVKAFHPFQMHIELGRELVLDGKYLICSIANGRFIGGGIPIAPLADVTDGKFDIVVVESVPRWKIPFYLPSLMMGTLYKRKIAHRYLAADCILSAHEMRLNLDGEILPISDAHFTCEASEMLLHW